MNEKNTTRTAIGFEWVFFICELCRIHVPVWQNILRPRPDWNRRRFCCSCAARRFSPRVVIR